MHACLYRLILLRATIGTSKDQLNNPRSTGNAAAAFNWTQNRGVSRRGPKRVEKIEQGVHRLKVFYRFVTKQRNETRHESQSTFDSINVPPSFTFSRLKTCVDAFQTSHRDFRILIANLFKDSTNRALCFNSVFEITRDPRVQYQR